MPSYLDFDSTKSFRDKILAKTLQKPNGPQTFTSSNYEASNLTDYANISGGTVTLKRSEELKQTKGVNIYKPDMFYTKNVETLPRAANLRLYPYFQPGEHTLIGILGQTDSSDNESLLYKFASSNILKDPNGFVKQRVSQDIGYFLNKKTTINGRNQKVKNENLSITVDPNKKSPIPNILGVIEGTDTYNTEIPGIYLTDPNNPYGVGRSTVIGNIIQDASGVLGSMLGIKNPLMIPVKPSDVFYQYMGENQKDFLENNLSYNFYAPDYSSTAMGLTTGGGLNLAGSLAQGILAVAGLGNPPSMAYIGDDRGRSLKYAMNDFNDRPVRSPYYLSLLFDPVQTILLQRDRNIGEGGRIGGNLTWMSKNSLKINKLGVNNKEWKGQDSNYIEIESTKFAFPDNSILGTTQDILNTLPNTGGSARSHVANAIDQTSRIFKDGDVFMARGSAVQYTDQFGQQKGVEFCRTWTKDRPYYSYSDLMPLGSNPTDILKGVYVEGTEPYRRTNVRRMDGSIMSTPWNLNIGPISDGNKGFIGSTNIKPKTPGGTDFQAKKYMLSIENLAWKTSTAPGFTVQDLPYSERGPNDGRVMWFPPYDLKVTEQNSARWESNVFLGRPEPIYTYQSTERTGTLSFKIVVDHPSILNLLVREYFKDFTSDEEADNYINAYFAGCQDLDFYSLIRKYATLDNTDIDLIRAYLNNNGDPTTIRKFKTITDDPVHVEPVTNTDNKTKTEPVNLDVRLNYINDEPKSYGNIPTKTKTIYAELAMDLTGTTFVQNQTLSLRNGIQNAIDKKYKKDLSLLFPSSNTSDITDAQKDAVVVVLTSEIQNSNTGYEKYTQQSEKLKNDIKQGHLENQDVKIVFLSSASVAATIDYNIKLATRRSFSVYEDLLSKISDNNLDGTPKWDQNVAGSPKGQSFKIPDITYTFEELGFTGKKGSITFQITNDLGTSDCLQSKFEDVDLRTTAPISYGCRFTQVKWEYTGVTNNDNASTVPGNTTPGSSTIQPSRIIDDGTITVNGKIPKPTIDVMKRIIGKTLQESYYFKKIEETDPVTFHSLKEKLKYFHPGFHSMTPEGLNSRLTFLHQCLRPGDTLPIKGVTDLNDMTARNTTFGPPPICVLRIGDFYHSKIVIRDLNITYDDAVWDLNPDGIGVQPMIAQITLQISFIGGQGLEKPVNQLQNALSSNFYANTEMYDERSIITNQYMGGVETSKFTKQFLESLNVPSPPKPPVVNNPPKPTIQGHYIGVLRPNQLFYGPLFDDLFTKTKSYVDAYQKMYNTLLTKYGSYVMNVFLSNKVRNLIEYDIWNDVSTDAQDQIYIFGVYEDPYSLTSVLTKFETALKNTIDSLTVSDMADLFNYTNSFTDSEQNIIYDTIYPWLTDLYLPDFLEDLNKVNITKTFETDTRNPLISLLDKLNFIVQFGQDAKMDGDKVIGSTFDDSTFSPGDFYKFYEPYVKYIKDNQGQFFTTCFDSTIDFDTTTLSKVHLSSILSANLVNDVEEIMGLFDTTVTNGLNIGTIETLKGKLTEFVKKPTELIFTIAGTLTQSEITNSVFDIIDEQEVTTQSFVEGIKKINSTKPIKPTSTLNYYKE